MDLSLPWTQTLKVIFSQEHLHACEFRYHYRCWVCYAEGEQEIIAEFNSDWKEKDGREIPDSKGTGDRKFQELESNNQSKCLLD